MRLFLIWVTMAGVCFADRPILLVTPAGVWMAVVDSAGKPGPWTPFAADVIVSGFGVNTPGGAPPVVIPPVEDETVKQVAVVSKSLRDKDEATAVAAIVDSVAKLNLSAADFKQALEMSAPIADAALGAGGRMTAWVKQATAVTTDPSKLKAGLMSAFGMSQETLDSIHAAAANPEAVATGEAINWTQLIAIIQMILTLLKNLGIGGAS